MSTTVKLARSPLPTVPSDPWQEPLSSSPCLRRDRVPLAQPHLAWQGLRPWLASWARGQASRPAGIQASASSLGILREQSPLRSVPTWAHRPPPSSRRQRRVWATRVPTGALTPATWGVPGRACYAARPGDPEWVLGPALTHGVAALLHGPNGASSLHAATQSPALFQILKGQKPYVTGPQLEPWGRGKGSRGPRGAGTGQDGGCAGHSR